MMKRTLVVTVVLTLITAACSSSPQASDSTAALPSSTTTMDDTTTSQPPPLTTTAPTTTTTRAATTTLATSEEDRLEITALYEVVFSSETGYEEKAPLIDDPTGLEDTVTTYQETGEQMGGVSLEARDISVAGDIADVTYDLLFAGTPTYPNLTGDAVRIDGVWRITREMFCTIMTSARVGCPAS